MTPPILLKQWADEFKKHAPSLRVLIYEGITPTLIRSMQSMSVNDPAPASSDSTGGRSTRGTKKQKQDAHPEQGKRPTDWKGYVAQFDVVLTTYTVLTKEVNIARAPVKRPRREAAAYHTEDRFRSPLIVVE